MLGQYGFLAKVRDKAYQTCSPSGWIASSFHTSTCIQVFSIFEELGISVDVVAGVIVGTRTNASYVQSAHVTYVLSAHAISIGLIL